VAKERAQFFTTAEQELFLKGYAKCENVIKTSGMLKSQERGLAKSSTQIKFVVTKLDVFTVYFYILIISK